MLICGNHAKHGLFIINQSECTLQGIWAGMIGGTAVQTVVLIYLTMRCDWDKEVSSYVSIGLEYFSFYIMCIMFIRILFVVRR